MKFSMPLMQKRRVSAFKNLPTPPEPINDRTYLATALGAAKADKKSGAYDEFLFTENSLVEMPFEESAENYLKLVSKRLEDQGRWEYLSYEKDVLQLEAKINIEKAKEAQLASDLGQIEKLIDREQAILDGDEPGRHGLYWKDSLPHLTSRPGGLLRLAAPYIVFALVGTVDLGILYYSLNNVPGIDTFPEVAAFTAPAVGASLVVPHFIGDRINLLVHGEKHQRVNKYELAFLAVIWILFISVMTQIRLNFMLEDELGDSIWRAPENQTAMAIMNFLFLAGLGTWLIFMAARRNPHQNNFLRLELRQQKLLSNLEKSTTTLVELQSRIPVAHLHREASELSFSANLSTATNELMKATKSTYRRALINEFGSTDFTSSYFKNQ